MDRRQILGGFLSLPALANLPGASRPAALRPGPAWTGASASGFSHPAWSETLVMYPTASGEPRRVSGFAATLSWPDALEVDGEFMIEAPARRGGAARPTTLDRLGEIIAAGVATDKPSTEIAADVVRALKGPHPGYWLPAFAADQAAREGVMADQETYAKGGVLAAQFACSGGERAIHAMVDAILEETRP